MQSTNGERLGRREIFHSGTCQNRYLSYTTVITPMATELDCSGKPWAPEAVATSPSSVPKRCSVRSFLWESLSSTSSQINFLPKTGAEILCLPQACRRGLLLLPNPELRPPTSSRTRPEKGKGPTQNKQTTQRVLPPSPPSKQIFTVAPVQKLGVWKGFLKSPNCRLQRAGWYRHTSGAWGAAKFTLPWPQDSGKRPQTPEVPRQHGGTSHPWADPHLCDKPSKHL